MLYQKNFFKNIVSKRVIMLMLIFVMNVAMASCNTLGQQQKRYIYIIGGAHKGERIVNFKMTNLYSEFPWEIFAIEANPYVIDKIPKAPDVTVLNKAIWIKDGTIEFYLFPKRNGLSSLYNSQRFEKKAVPITVESFDFGQWLKRNFTKDDFIFVSFDIEGAEYEVLNNMLIDKTIQYIDVLCVETHYKITGKSNDEYDELIKKIRKFGVYVEEAKI